MPRRVLLGAAVALTAVLLPLLLTALWTGERAAAAERERHGSTVVRRLAASAADSLLAGDRIALNVLAREFTTLPGIATAALYSADNRLLAAADGAGQSPSELDAVSSDRVYVEQITLQESIAGYARIALVPDAFAPNGKALLAAVAIVTALCALALAWTALEGLDARLVRMRERVADLLGEDHGGSDAWRALSALLDPPSKEPAEPDAPAAAGAAEDRPSHLVVVNLFNQISLSNAERESVLETCEGLLDRVCRLYGGRHERLPGTGLLIALDPLADREDPAFQAICTALLAARVFDDLNHERRREGEVQLALRIGVERIVDEVEEQDPHSESIGELFPESVSRAVTLSALARGGGVVIGDAVHDACAGTDRVEADPVESPVLRATLGTGPGARAWLVRDLADGYRGLLDRQAALLIGGR